MRFFLIALLLSWLAPLFGMDSSLDLGLGPVPYAPGAVAISGGTINGATIGGSTPASGTFTTGTFTTSITNSGLTSTRVVYSGASGIEADDSGFTRTSLALTLDANTDNTLTTGYGKLGLASSGTSTSWYLAQASNYNSTDYMIRQNSAGGVEVNAKSGTNLILGVNNINEIQLSSAALAFGAFGTTTYNATTDATSKTTGAVTTLGGISAAKNIIGGEGIASGVTSTATAAGTTTLTSSSTGVQIFTGSTTQTVQLPAANLFGAGVSVEYVLINRSTGNVSWQRAGSDTINGATSTVAVSTNTVSIIWSDGVSAWYTK